MNISHVILKVKVLHKALYYVHRTALLAVLKTKRPISSGRPYLYRYVIKQKMK